MKRFFITGTDTDCGKTYVTCQLLDYFYQRDKKAIGIKPVASGCFIKEGQKTNDDLLRLQKHNRVNDFPVNQWLLSPPISPHLAAKEEGVQLSLPSLESFCLDKVYDHLDCLLIEGAGGLLVPLNDEETWLDFLSLTHIPVILVVGIRLGCINHALLTDRVLHDNKLPGLGWVANILDKNMLALEENIGTLTEKMHLPFLGKVLYGGEFVNCSLDLDCI